jgi:acyl carrier protein
VPELIEHLTAGLPDYMVPSAWVVLRQLPLTPNGKIDRRALPSPQTRAEDAGEYIAPRNQLERELAQIWAQVLQVDQIGIEDNFFEVGGHSLLAMQVMVHLRSSMMIELPMSVLFERPTIRALAEHVAGVLDARNARELGDAEESWSDLLEQVAAMPECQVQEMVKALRMRT